MSFIDRLCNNLNHRTRIKLKTVENENTCYIQQRYLLFFWVTKDSTEDQQEAHRKHADLMRHLSRNRVTYFY